MNRRPKGRNLIPCTSYNIGLTVLFTLCLPLLAVQGKDQEKEGDPLAGIAKHYSDVISE